MKKLSYWLLLSLSLLCFGWSSCQEVEPAPAQPIEGPWRAELRTVDGPNFVVLLQVDWDEEAQSWFITETNLSGPLTPPVKVLADRSFHFSFFNYTQEVRMRGRFRHSGQTMAGSFFYKRGGGEVSANFVAEKVD